MIRCLRARKQFWRILEGRQVDAWVADHVRHCPSCAREAALLQREAGRLRAPELAAPPAPDPDRMWARIEARLPQPRRSPWMALAPLASAVVVAAAFWMARPAPLPDTPAPVVSQREHPAPAAPKLAAANPAAPAARPPRSAAPASVGRHVVASRRPHRLHPAGRHGAGRVGAPAISTLPMMVAAAPAAGMPGIAPAPPRIATPATEPAPQPVAVLVVARVSPVPESAIPSPAYTYSSCESTDPASGDVMRLAVSRETDASGKTRSITIDCNVQPSAAQGGAGDSST